MLIKNIDVVNGLCNKTRLQVVDMLEDNLKCKMLTSARSRNDANNENFVYLSIPFEYEHKNRDMMVRFWRVQFPILLAFTIIKIRLRDKL